MLKIAINGFGRIGRNFLRAIMADEQAKKSLKLLPSTLVLVIPSY